MDIYIRLLEGTETYVPVEAIQIEGDKYEIIKNEFLQLQEDATSIWEFFPGDVVSCRLIDGKLIAQSYLSTTFPDRKIYELIFAIVKNVGSISPEIIASYAQEIKKLCQNKSIVQRNHPLVNRWIETNCIKMK